LAAAPALIEGDATRVATELHDAGAGIRDGSLYTVDIRLMSYARGKLSLAPVERRFVMIEPTIAAEEHRGGEATQALGALINGLARLCSAKERNQ
jgi:hypothetical protein